MYVQSSWRAEGWLAIEAPNVPGVCGEVDGGVKFAEKTTASCTFTSGGDYEGLA